MPTRLSDPASIRHADDRESERHFVADHLGRRPQRAEQWIFAVRGPAPQDDPENTDRRNRQHVKHADVEVGNIQTSTPSRPPRPECESESESSNWPEWNDRENDECRNQGDDRSQHEDPAIRPRRNDVFLEQQLDTVRDRLKQAPGPTRIGPSRTCMKAITFALEQA